MTQTMSVEPFKVMVVGDVAPARHALIAVLRRVGLWQNTAMARTMPWMQFANGTSTLLFLTSKT
jgi:hypothetical protein